MGLDLDELFRMVQSMGFGNIRSTGLMAKLLRSYEVNLLKQVKKAIDARLEEISKAGVGATPFANLDPFSILGVSMNASREVVDKAYKSKAWVAHPDHGGTDEEMAKVNAAYEVIYKFKGWAK